AVTIVVSVLVALTVLPAFIGVLGEKMRPKPRKRRAAAGPAALPDGTPAPAGKKGNIFTWWVGVTTKHPIVTIVAVVAGVGALSIPAAGMVMSLPNAGQNEAGTPSRVAYDLISDNFGPGFNGPLIVT